MSSSTAAPAPYTKNALRCPVALGVLTANLWFTGTFVLLVIFDGADTVRLDAGLSVCGGVAIAPGMLLGVAG